MFKKHTITILIALVVVFLSISTFIDWTINHIYVKQGYSLQLRYRGAPLPLLPGYSTKNADPGTFAKVDKSGNPLEKGVLQELRGPGRHFYSPFWYETKLIPDITVNPGEIAIVKSKMGKDPPPGKFIVDGDLNHTEFKGILRKAYGPGTYRVNDYAYEFQIVKPTPPDATVLKHSGWVLIRPGYVGVVTNLVEFPEQGITQGVQDNVLPAGLYPINPQEQQVNIVEVGFLDLTLSANLQTNKNDLVYDESGEPIPLDDGSGISFRSGDGNLINIDFTAIWGVMPHQAPNIVRNFGTLEAVESRVIRPNMESICRNVGSKYGAIDLLVGDSRQKFQEQTTIDFKRVLDEKGISLLNGLVRNIHIPQEIRIPKQKGYVADENSLTRKEEQETAKTEAVLKEETQKIQLEIEKVQTQIEKECAEKLATGQKLARETAAETEREVAAIMKQTAILEAQASVLLGEAKAEVQKQIEQAKAEKFKLAVEAFGSNEAYNKWVFANGLPQDIQLELFYAGEGTLWTDLKGFTETMLGKEQAGTKATPKAK